MTRDVDAEVVPAAAVPHFVLKRGRKGRFRFAMSFPWGRMTGEVWVDDQGDRARPELALEARRAVRNAGDLLVLATTTTEGEMADPAGMRRRNPSKARTRSR